MTPASLCAHTPAIRIGASASLQTESSASESNIRDVEGEVAVAEDAKVAVVRHPLDVHLLRSQHPNPRHSKHETRRDKTRSD
eukprot:705784-Rhodomonas_salina.4